MAILKCSICGVELECEDAFEAGMFTMEHWCGAHPELIPADIQIRCPDEHLGEPPIWTIERVRPLMQ